MPAREQSPNSNSDAARGRISRRGVLASSMLGAAAALAGQLITQPRAAAATKVQKSDAEYKDSPRGGMRCDRCIQFLPPASCKVVSGPISASGSCDLFAPKPR